MLARHPDDHTFETGLRWLNDGIEGLRGGSSNEAGYTAHVTLARRRVASSRLAKMSFHTQYPGDSGFDLFNRLPGYVSDVFYQSHTAVG